MNEGERACAFTKWPNIYSDAVLAWSISCMGKNTNKINKISADIAFKALQKVKKYPSTTRDRNRYVVWHERGSQNEDNVLGVRKGVAVERPDWLRT